ncbi:hypothetical protein ICU_04704 [Bacillus cereus BAG2X1-1]|nr:hypothetical protein ICU_04704 [Bacillus cereus BAG2X1-1]
MKYLMLTLCIFDNHLNMHGQLSKKYMAKYNIEKNKIKLRSDCLCIVNIFHPMKHVWNGANPKEDKVMNVPIYVSYMQGQDHPTGTILTPIPTTSHLRHLLACNSLTGTTPIHCQQYTLPFFQ